MRWNNNTSRFVLRRMAQLLSDGSRLDKVFKDKDVNLVAKHLKEYSGEAVSPTQVYNHLRKWRQKWARISKLKDLSGAMWDSDANSIMLEGEQYLGHCKNHPKDSEFLNYPIRFYTEMDAIFGHAMATGRFALRSSEALGVNQADSVAAKVEGYAFNHVGGKRKMGNFTEDEMLMLINMSDAVNNVANALRETGLAHVDPDLFLAVMEMPGFSKEALICAYTFLLDNKA
ncbi:unnamed protein product [Miscanthus lutarioriparius]|uniref:Myb/SANT-like domain-containing protein n=1 Tax=Miscanthus lutarioriparius TaxID=422564 RepID=A0A811R279_9POAL|nr:unnamed protein product [Miscanthus lutarioriparius]